MKHHIVQNLAPLIGVLLFAVALWVLHHELRAYHYHDVLQQVATLPLSHVLLALILTLLNYLALTGYDVLAVCHIGQALSYRRVALTSFISYAFSHNVGLSLLSGDAVRYRLYSSWGLSGVDITAIIAFTSVTFWLGFCTLGGTAFLLEPLMISPSFGFPGASMQVRRMS
jgi:phosphatidylglycerol lysyltransferase